MKEITFANASIVTPREVVSGSVAVKDGVLVEIGFGKAVNAGDIDLGGDYLLPGLVELHTDHLESHFTPRPGVRWPALAAVLAHDSAVIAAGITTVFDALAIGDLVEDSVRLRDLRDIMEGVQEAKRKKLLRADHLLHLRCEVAYPRSLEIFEKLVREPFVRLVSLMDHTPGQRQFTCLKKLYQYYQGKHGLTDEQMQQLILKRKDNQKNHASRNRKEILKMCRELKLPVASHDDTTVEHVYEAASEGVLLSEFPTTIEAAKTARALGLQVLMGAPNLILGGSHSGNVSALELGRLGLLDILSSDYVPSSLIHGAFLLHRQAGLPLPQAIATVTLHPARATGLEDRGSVEVGKRADLIRVAWDGALPVVRNVWRGGEQIF